MTNKFCKYPSIENERNFFKAINHNINNDCVRVNLCGTVKLHGTNGGIGFWKDGEITAQSRNRILGIGIDDNAGFNQWVTENFNQKHREEVVTSVTFDEYQFDGVILYGEWVGENIQKGVALSGMEKAFVVFGAALVELSDDGENLLQFGFADKIIESLVCDIDRLFSISEFQQFEIKDVNPWCKEEILAKLQELTENVDKNCPVGNVLNPNSPCTVGEGIVWEVFDSRNGQYFGRFKSKGESHKRKGEKQFNNTLSKPIDPAVKDFIEMTCSVDRLAQGLENIDSITTQCTGQYLKWVCCDVKKEFVFDIEDIYNQYGIEWKTLSKEISKIAKEYFFQQM